MLVGEKRGEAERQEALAELTKQERVASKADEMLGSSYMMSRSTGQERKNMGPQKLRGRISYIKGARMIGSLLVRALRSSDESAVHVEAEVRDQLEQAKGTDEYANAMLFAINGARSELLSSGRITLSPGSMADFEFGSYGTSLDELLSKANRIAGERERRIEKISKEQRVTESEKLGYMVTTAIIGELRSDMHAFRKDVISGRTIYDKARSVVEYLGRERMIYLDPFGRPPERAALDFLDRIDLISADSIVEELEGGNECIAAVYMLIRQAAADAIEDKRNALAVYK